MASKKKAISKTVKLPAKNGRPSKYSKEVADKICMLLSTTSKGLVNICKLPQMPDVSTVYDWLANPNYKEFTDSYARAREAQADLLADEIIEIADTEKRTVSTNEGDQYSTVTESDNPARSRLMIDARKWKASKLAPKKYGDKVDVTTNGENLNAPALKIEIVPPLKE